MYCKRVDPRDPSVPDTWEFDAACPGGKAHFIVFYRQSSKDRPSCWILERTSDKAMIESGTLDEMLALLDKYPHARRASWAEDQLRFRPAIFDMELTYNGEVVGERAVVVEGAPKKFVVEPLPVGGLPTFEGKPK